MKKSPIAAASALLAGYRTAQRSDVLGGRGVGHRIAAR